MTVDLFLISFLHTEDDLRRHNALVGILEVQIGVDCKRRRILEQVCGDWPMIDNVSHVTTWLIHAEEGQDIENTWMYSSTTVGNDAYNHLRSRLAGQADPYSEAHLLPRLNAPCMRVFTSAQVRNITHDAV